MTALPLITKYNLRKIRKHFFSNLFVLICIIIGTGGVFAALAVGGSVQNSVDVEFSTWDVAHMSLITDGISPDIQEAIASIPGIEEVEWRLVYKTDLYYENIWRRFVLVGISDFAAIKISKFAEEIPSEIPPNSILLDSSVQKLGIKEGEKIQFYSSHGPIFLTVAGFYRNPEFLSYSYSREAIGYCSMETSEKISGIETPNCILIQVEDVAKIDGIYKTVMDELSKRDVSVISFERNTSQDYHIRTLLIQTQFLVIMISLMVLLVACIFLWNSTTAFLLESRKEIQIMEILGLSRRHRFLMYFPSKLYLTVIGTLIGLPTGWVLHRYLTLYFCEILNIQPYLLFSGSTLMITVLLGVVFTSFFSLVPVWMGSQITGDEITFPQYILRFLKRIHGHFTLNIAISSIFSHKMRNIISIVGLGFVISLFIVIQSTGTSIRTTLDEEIYEIRSYDFYVYFDLPVEYRSEISTFIESVEGVEHFEYWYVREGFVGGDSVQVCGIPEDTQIYRPNIIDGRYFESSEINGALISKYLSRDNRISVGDHISVGIEAKRVDLEVIGILADADHDGKTIFVPIAVLQDLTDARGKITHIMIDLIPPAEMTSERTGFLIKEGLLAMNIHGTIRTKNESKEKTENLTTMFLLLFYSFLVFAGIIVFINTAYTLTFNVIDRKDEFALIETLGGRRRSIFAMILATATMLALPAWALSLIFGPYLSEIFVQYVAATMLPITYTFSESSLVAGLALALFISFLGALYSMGYAIFKLSL